MQGGKRENAGRKPISKNEKKLGYKIYLPPKLSNDIDLLGTGNSFSEKCAQILKLKIDEMQKNKNQTIKIIDLFAGLGGIRLGFEQAAKEQGINVQCVFSSEIKKYAIRAYKNFFGDEHIYGDITKISSQEIPAFDFLLAGFPCQPFSAAGKGLGFQDTRGTLFFEIERILKDKKPYGFLLENVEGLVNHDGGKTLSTIISHLKALGYLVSWKLIDSQNFNLAQSRKRVYIVGTRKHNISLDDFPIQKTNFGNIMQKGLPTINSQFTKCLFKNYKPEQIYGKSIKDKRGGSDNIHSWDLELKGETTTEERNLLNIMLKERRKKKWAQEIGIKWMDGMPLTTKQIKTFFSHPHLENLLNNLTNKGYLKYEYPKELVNGIRIPDKTKPKGYNIVSGKLSFEFSKILNPKQLAPTLVATDVSKLGVIDNNGLRKITIREGQRLCGYPETYDLSFLKETEAFDLLGNTVCVPVIKAIASRLTQAVLIQISE